MIKMCKGGNCPAKSNCFRFKAVPNENYQTWLVNIPYDYTGCQKYMAVNPIWSFQDMIEKSKKEGGNYE